MYLNFAFIAILLFSFLTICPVKAQNKDIGFQETELKTVLKAEVVLPDSGYSITKVKFVVDSIGEILASAIHRDRYLTFKKAYPKTQVVYFGRALKVITKDTTVYLPFAIDEAVLSKILSKDRSIKADPIKIYADMLICSYPRYGITRDLIVREIIY